MAIAEKNIDIQSQDQIVTLKSVGIGLLLILVSDYYINWSTVLLQASKNNKSFFPMGLFFPFIVLVAGNILVHRIQERWALTRGEMCVALGMGLIGAFFPFFGLASYVVGTVAAPYYFNTPENGWGELLHPHMESWLVLNNEDMAATWFFDGLPPGQGIPWQSWMIPLFWWMTLIAAASCVVLCLMVMLRKQWVEHERLEYPLMEVGMRIANIDGSEDSLIRNRSFWVGAIFGFIAVAWNIFSYFFPLMPGIPTIRPEGHWFDWLQGAKPFWVQLNVYVLGFAYFARVEASFSYWVFFLFTEMEVVFFDRLGIAAGHGGGEAVRSQNFGVLCAYVIFGLWMGREHLKGVIRKIFTPALDIDDSKEVLTYRAAGIGLIVGLIYMMAWLSMAGMELKVIALYLFFTVMAYIGLARFVAELGLPYGDVAYNSITWTSLYILGGQTVSASTLTVQGYLWTLFGKIRGFLGPPIAQFLKLTSSFRFDRRRLLIALGLAIGVGVVFSVFHAIYMGYSSGGFNLRAAWNLLIGPQNSYNQSVKWIRNPEPPDKERMLFMGSGVFITAVLTYLKYRFVSLPLHPVALMLQGTAIARNTVFSVFLTWAYKSTVLKFGGVQLYRKGQPFFIGLLIGYAISTFLSCVVDSVFFYGQGHMVHGF